MGRGEAEQIGRAAAELETAPEEVNEAKRQGQRGRAEKHKAAAYDEIFLRTARMFQDLCRCAGEHELADQVRPSSIRKGPLRQRVSRLRGGGSRRAGNRRRGESNLRQPSTS